MGKINYTVKPGDRWPGKREHVTGEAFIESPGLAIRKDDNDDWVVTHLASGYAASFFKLKRQAIAFAAWLASRIDCTQKYRAFRREVKRKKLRDLLMQAARDFKNDRRK